jgi:hypothetical protein
VGCEVADEVGATVTVEDIAGKLRGMATELISEEGKDQELREAMAEELRSLAGLLEGK